MASWMLAMMAKGQTPTAQNAQAPADQKYVAWFAPPAKAGEQPTLTYAQNPNYDPRAAKTTVYGSADGGYFTVDDSGNSTTVREPNADALVSNAIDRQTKEALRNERQANSDAGKGYLTTAERAQIENQAHTQGLDDQKFRQQLTEYADKQKRQDQYDAQQAETVKASLAQTGAQTQLLGAQAGKVGAETTQTQTQTDVLKATTPSTIEEAQARAQLARAQAATAEQKLKQPQVLTAGVEGPSIYTQGPGGEVQAQMRQGYVPKTLPEIQARIGQIHAAANAKAAQLQGKIGPDYSADQADAEFRAWYDQNVSPETGTLASAQEQAIQDRATAESAAKTTAYNSALTAGQNAVSAYQNQARYRVGPGAAEALKQASTGDLSKVDWSNSAVYQGQDPEKLRQSAVADALKYLNPMAAQMANVQQPGAPGGLNPQDALNMSNWTFKGAPPPAAGAAAPAAGAAAPSQQSYQIGLGFNPNMAPGGAGLADQQAQLAAQAAAAAAPPPGPGPAPAPAAAAPYAAPRAAAPAAPAAAAPAPWTGSDTLTNPLGTRYDATPYTPPSVSPYSTPETSYIDPMAAALAPAAAAAPGATNQLPPGYIGSGPGGSVAFRGGAPMAPPAGMAYNGLTGAWEAPDANSWSQNPGLIPGAVGSAITTPTPKAPSPPSGQTGYMQPGMSYNAVTGAWEAPDAGSWQQHPELIPGAVGGIGSAIGNYLFPTGYR